MSHFVIALIATAGAAAWIFNKLQRQSGNNTKQSLSLSAIAGVVLFVIIILILGMLPK